MKDRKPQYRAYYHTVVATDPVRYEAAKRRARAWYYKNIGYAKQQVAKRVKIVRAWLNDHKAFPCADCKVIYPPWVMDFDHVKGKKRFTISHRSTYAKARLEAEIKKCEVVCANCHRIRTHARRKDALHP